MEDRPTKLARLQSLRDRVPYVSQSALAAILKIAQSEPLPTGRRNDIKDARDAVALSSTPYGRISQVITLRSATGGSDMSVELQHPFAMFYYCCSTSRALSALVTTCVERHPPTLSKPWNIIVYTDEISPGNQLGYQNHRKFWAIYWSILEWGPEVLSDEDTWQAKSRMSVVVASAMHHTMLQCMQ